MRFRRHPRRVALLAGAALAGALALPGVAQAVVATITSPFDATALASCPGTATLPCTVISRTTAFQDVVGTVRTPMTVLTTGRVVGWEITLSAPSTAQIKYFDATEGGTSRAALAVLRNVRGLGYRLVATAPLVHLEPYFGKTASFALATTIPVVRGDLLALTVPTWAPALELRAGRRTAWRASRRSSECTAVTHQTAQGTAGSVAQYGCLYPTALVRFAAIEISTP
jgi:hypothetical protein